MAPGRSRELKIELTGDARDLQRSLGAGGRSLNDFDREVEKSSRKLDDHSKSTDRAERGLDRMNVALGNSTHQTKVFARTVDLVKPAALITGVGLLAQGLSAVAAGGAAAAAGLAPAAGAMAAYPALATAAAQATGVFRLATEGLQEALSGDEQALAKLTPRAREFVAQLKELEPLRKSLRESAQEGFFPGAAEGLQDASRNASVLKGIAGDTGTALGALARQAGELLGSKGVGRDLELQGQRNTRWIRELGEAGIDGADALRHITIAAGPLTDHLVDMVGAGARNTREFTRQARATGDLQRFFALTERTVDTLVGTAGNLARGLWEIGRAGQPLGSELLGDVEDLTQQFEDWSKSVQGQSALRDYFNDAEPAIRQTAGLVGDVGEMFLRLGRGDQVAPLISQIRTELLPVIEQLIDGTTEALGPELIDALVQITKLFATLSGSSGPLVAFVDTIGDGARLLNDLIETFPALGTAVVTLAAMGGIAKALNVMSAITGMRTLLGLTRTLKTEQAAVTAIGGLGVVGPGNARGGRGGKGPGAAGAGGVLGGAAAGSVGGPWGALAGAAVGAGVLFGPGIVDKINDGPDEKARKKFEDATGGAKTYREQIRKVTEEIQKLHEKEKQVAEHRRSRGLGADSKGTRELRAEANALRKLRAEMHELHGPMGKVQDAFKAMRSSAGLSLRAIRDTVRDTTETIKYRLGADTKAGREALSRNFNIARQAIRQSMKDGTIHVKDGMREIRRLMEQELQAYGLNPRQARNAARTGDMDANEGREGGASRAGAGNASGTAAGYTDRAVGGWIGAQGMAGRDDVPVMLGVGEAVLNRHQQGPVEYALQSTFGMTLDDLFSQIDRPHYMARGGMVAGRFGGDMPGMAKGGIVQLGRRLQGMGYHVSEHPAFGGVAPGVHAPNGWHYKSGALDVNADHMPGGEMKNLDALAAMLRRAGWHVLWRVKDHFDHLHVDVGGGAGGMVAGGPAAVPKIKRVKMEGSGLLGRVGQGALDRVRSAAQKSLEEQALAGMGETGGNSKGGGKPASTAQVRRWVAAGLRLAGVPATPANISTVAARAMQESSGNPRAVNNWDVNAQRGDPSKGLMQTIGATFRAYQVPGAGDIFNPVHNVAAAVRYMLARYGRLVGAGSGGYSKGGRVGIKPGKKPVAQVRPGSPGSRPGGRPGGPLSSTMSPGIRNPVVGGLGSSVFTQAPEGFSELGPVQVPEVPAPPTELDYLDAALAQAELTADIGDDTAALANLVAFRERDYAAAVASGDPRRVAQAARDLKAARDQQGNLLDVMKQLADAIKAQTEEVKRQNDFADSVAAVGMKEAMRALADVVSGQIVGVGYQGRSQLAGSGSAVRY